MHNQLLLYIGGGLTTLWGIAHLFPTRSVVRDFGDISEDNRKIIMMEWIVEGVALIFIGALVIVVTLTDPRTGVSKMVYRICSLGLIIMAVISLHTGFKIKFLPFKLCPLVFALAATFILLGVYL